MSRLDIAERRIPQDGRIKMRISKNRAIDFRVSTCPTLFGEKIVARILDPSSAMLGIDALGYEPAQTDLYMTALAQPHEVVDPALSRVCKAFHYEYNEVALLYACAVIVLGQECSLDRILKSSVPGFKLSFLRRVKRCTIFDMLMDFSRGTTEDQMTTFGLAVAQHRHDRLALESLEWTPTKGKKKRCEPNAVLRLLTGHLQA